jgi:D-glycero-alpha-D-manno-heptose-7-phosphate kinase
LLFRSRAPLRLGLAGGGSDVSPYSDKYGGYVLNATINLYSYCTIEPTNHDQLVLVAADRNETETLAAPLAFTLSSTVTLPLHKAVYNRVVREFNAGRPLPCTITTYSDAPAGSGLGTSSTMTVAILAAFVEWLNLPLGEYEIAHLAYEIERIELGLAGGKQDQYAAAFGGFNFMEFHASDRVIVNPLRIGASTINEFQSSLLLFYTGASRDSAKIISEQMRSIADMVTNSLEAMHRVKSDAIQMKEHLLKGDMPALARGFRNSWEAKKQTSSVVSNAQIESVFSVALEAGALAGKVSGAGGGGYIMFMIDPCKREQVIRALRNFSGAVQHFQFTDCGVESWRIR